MKLRCEKARTQLVNIARTICRKCTYFNSRAFL